MAIRSTIKKKEKKNKGGIVGGAGYLLGSGAAGIAGVGEGIIDLGLALGADITGNHAFAEYVFKDNVVGDWHADITEEYNPDTVMKFGGDVAHGLGQSSWFLLSLIPGAQWLGPAVFGTGMVGQGISSAAEVTGDVGVKEAAYGVTTAALETGLEWALGGMGTVAKAGVGAAAKSTGKQALKSIASSATRKGLASKLFSAAAGEFAEEFVSEYADTFLQRAYQIDPDKEYSLKDALYAGAVGAASGGISAGSVDVVNTTVNQQRGARIIKNGNAQTLVNTANLVADKLAASGTDFKKAPEWVKTLRGEVDAYNKLVDKGQGESLSAQTILGEMQASLYFAETQAIHSGFVKEIQNASESDRAALAEYINLSVDKSKRKKDYTAEDIKNDTDEVAKQLATMKFVGYAFDFDGAMADMEQESAVENVIAKEQEKAAQNAQAQAQNAEGGVQSEVKYSLSETTDGRSVAVVDDDILSGIYTGTWDKVTADKAKKAAKTALMKFKDGIVVKGITSKVNRTSRREYTRSNYSEALKKHDPETYADKMRAASVTDDVVVAATDWNRDGGLTHPREDDFVDFDRGQTLIVSGNNKYTATVILGITSKGEYVFYDVEDMTPTQFDIKKDEVLSTVTPDEPFDDMLKDSNNSSIPQPEGVVKPESEKNISKPDLVENAAKTAQEAQSAGEGTVEGAGTESGAGGAKGGKKPRIRSTLKKRTEAESDSKGASSSVRETDRGSSEDSPALGKAKSESEAKSEPKVSEAKESQTDAQRVEKARERAEKWIEWEKKTAPSASELNVAREYVKGFDNLGNTRRLAIIRMIRSSEGKVDKKILKGLANLMAITPKADLEIRFAEGIGNGGLYTHAGNKALILLDPSANYKDSIKGTIAHELVHYIENKAVYKEFADYVMKRVKPERRAEVEKLYNKRYTEIYAKEAENQGLVGDDIKKYVADKMATEEHKARIESEVVAKYVGKALNNEKLLKKYADKDKKLIAKVGEWLVQKVKAMKNKNLDAETVKIAEDMAFRVTALLQDTKTAGESKGEAKYEIKYPRFSQKEIGDNIKSVATMQSVITISEDKLKPSGKAPSVLYEEYFKSLGENIYSEIYGDIAIKKSSTRSEIRHGNTAEKIASMEAIPTVIDQGKVIAILDKGAGVERLVIAAPIVIGKTDYLMGVMLQRDAQNQRLYLHNVVLKEKTTSSQEVDLLTTGTYNENDRLFITSILQKVLSVNTSEEKNITKADLAETKYDLDERKVEQTSKEEPKQTENAAEKEAKKAKLDKLLKKKERQIREKIARENAEAARAERAKRYTKKEITDAVNAIEALTDTEILSLAKGYELKGMTKARRDALVSQIYIALHEESAKGESGLGSIPVKGLASKIAWDTIQSAEIKGEDGKSYHFTDIYDEASVQQFADELTDEVYKMFGNMGEHTNNSYFQAELRAVREKFRQERFVDAKIAKFAREVSYQGMELRDIAAHQKREGVTEGLGEVTKKLAAIVDPKGNIRVGVIDKAMREAAVFLEGEAGKLEGEANKKRLANEELSSSDVAEAVMNADLRYKVDEFLRLRKGHEKQALTAQEMEFAGDILRTMKKTINEYNKEYINDRLTNIDEAAAGAVKGLRQIIDLENKKEYKTKIGKLLGSTVGTKVNEFYFYKILSPETIISSLEGFADGGLLGSMYHTIRLAQARSNTMATRMLKPFDEFLRDKENRWEGTGEDAEGGIKGWKYSYRDKLNVKKISVNGEYITLGEAFNLYMLTKREEAHAGLRESGYIVFDDSGKQRTIKIEDIESTRDFIGNQFDEVDRKFLKMAEDFFNVTASKIKYDADMKIFGYTNNGEGYYVPMVRDRYSRMKGVTDARFSIGETVTLYSPSFTKNLVANANGLEGTNIMLLIDRHARGLADYSELYLPLKAFDRVYNRGVATETGITSIRKELNNDRWADTDDYFKKLFKDVQHQYDAKDIGAFDAIVGKLRSAWVNSVLGANIKVIATQTTSLGAATQMIEPKYITQASRLIIPGIKVNEIRERAYKYSNVIEARAFDMTPLKAQGNVEKISRIGEISGLGIGWMDERVTLAIFHAAELKVEAQGYAIGTEENATRAAKLADETILATQSMSDTTEKSALQRSKSEIAKLFSMFTSDTVKNLSHFYGNLMQYKSHKALADAGNAKYAEMLKQDKAELLRSTRTLAITGIMLGLISQAFKYLYAKEEEEPEDKLKDFGLDIVSSTLNILPGVSDVIDKVVFNYDMSVNVLDVANDTIETFAKGAKLAGKSMNGEFVSTQDVASAMINIIKSTLSFGGIPISPVERTVTGLLRRVAPSAIYGYDSLFYNPSYTSDLKAAVENGDDALAEYVLEQLYKSEVNGTYTSAELEEVVRLYGLTDEDGKHYSVLPQKIGKEINGVTLTAAQRKKFTAIYAGASGEVNKLISSPYYGTLTDEQRAKAIKNIYSLYYDRAAAEVVGKEWSNAVAYSYLTDNYVGLFAAQAYKSGLSEEKDASGKKITVGQQFVEYAKNLGLSESDYVVITYANGVRNKENRAALLAYINSLSLSPEIKAKIAERLGFEVKDGVVVEKSDNS